MSQAALALYLRIVTARPIPIMMRRLKVLDSRKPRSFYTLPVPFASPFAVRLPAISRTYQRQNCSKLPCRVAS